MICLVFLPKIDVRFRSAGKSSALGQFSKLNPAILGSFVNKNENDSDEYQDDSENV